MSVFDDPLQDGVADMELVAIDAAFERLLANWHQASAALTHAISAQLPELQLHKLRRANTEARRQVVDMLNAMEHNAT